MEERQEKKNREPGILHNLVLWWRKAGKRQRGLCAAGLAAAVILLAWALGGMEGRREAPALSRRVLTAPTASLPPVVTPSSAAASNQEEKIYSYLQGPRSWGERLKWSGQWGVTFYDGGSFGGFGCGLCCMANIYSSLTEYRCSPIDAYRYAKRHTGYAGGGAIDWGYMKSSLSSMGFTCGVHKKPSSYREFREQIEKCQAAVALVSSSNSTCYWKNTPGHYVTLFLCGQKKDKVFLTDSGDPDHNRHWVSLKKIYASLKTSSSWQYLTVTGYSKAADRWKHKKAGGNWVKK